MTYHPEEYQVTDIREYEDGGMAFDVTIKGAEFIIYRYLNNYKPTKMMRFNDHIRPVVDENRTVTGTVELDWDTCLAGMQHIAEQMSKLAGITFKVIPGIHFGGKARRTYFKIIGGGDV